MRSVLPLSLALLVAAGCSKEYEPPPPDPEEEAAKAEKKKNRSNVVKVQTAVAYGKHVACEDLIDLAAFAASSELDLAEMRDRGKSNSGATAVCAFMRAGKPPAGAAQEKQYKKNAKLGVLPGDEYCMFRAQCDTFADPAEFKDTCRSQGNEINESLPVTACVRRSQRASEWAYTYKVIDPDTGCVLEVLGGPSVTDESLVQACTKAALEGITKEGLENVRDEPGDGVVSLEASGEAAPEEAAGD